MHSLSCQAAPKADMTAHFEMTHFQYFFVIARVGGRHQVLAAVRHNYTNHSTVSVARRAFDILNLLCGDARSAPVKRELLASNQTKSAVSANQEKREEADVSNATTTRMLPVLKWHGEARACPIISIHHDLSSARGLSNSRQ